MKDSLVIVAFFILGVVCGLDHILLDVFAADSDISFYALCALMFLWE